MSSIANPDVYAFRWSSDVSDFGTPSFLAADNISIEIAQADLDSTVFFLYLGVENDGDMSASSTFQLQHDNATNEVTWEDVDSASSHVRTVAGQDDDEDTGLQPTGFPAGIGIFIGAEYSDATPSAIDVNCTGGNFIVVCFSIQLQGADLSGGETVKFRLTHGGADMTNDSTPICTIETAGPGPIPPPQLRSFAITRASNY